VRQSHVSDFMEHMLNRGRTYAIGTMRSNIHFSARFCRSVDLNESESFGFLWVLQTEIESSCILLSFSPRLCLFAKLFFCHRFCKHSLVLLYSSLFWLFSSFSFLHRAWLNLRWFSIYTILLREKIYMSFKCRRANGFLRIRLFPVIPVKKISWCLWYVSILQYISYF